MSSSVPSDSLSSFPFLFDGLSCLIMFLWCALSFWSGQTHSGVCVALLAAHHDDSTATSPDYFLWCIILNITCVVLALWCFCSWCCMTILAMWPLWLSWKPWNDVSQILPLRGFSSCWALRMMMKSTYHMTSSLSWMRSASVMERMLSGEKPPGTDPCDLIMWYHLNQSYLDSYSPHIYEMTTHDVLLRAVHVLCIFYW